jgi:ribosomal protein S8
MAMSDPIADMLTRIRNAQLAEKASVSMPSSRLKVAIAAVLKEEGYVDDFAVRQADGKPTHRAHRTRLEARPADLPRLRRHSPCHERSRCRHRVDPEGRHD